MTTVNTENGLSWLLRASY